jgi:hypothetical protein
MVYSIVASKVFGPTDSAADTLTKLAPTTGWLPAKSYHCSKLRVGYGNVVNAKECSGFIHIDVSGVGYFAYAFGNGIGGASNSSNQAAEEIVCSIPIPQGSTVIISVLQAEVSKDVTVSLSLSEGIGPTEMTLAGGGAGIDTSADTELTIAVNAKLSNIKLTPNRSGYIRQIRIAGSGAVDAKAGSAKLVLDVGSYAHPLEFAFGMGPGGATLGAPSPADVINNLAIPVQQNIPIVAKITSAEIILSVSISFSVM